MPTICQECHTPLALLNTFGPLKVYQCFNCKDDFGNGRVFMQGDQIVPAPQERVGSL